MTHNEIKNAVLGFTSQVPYFLEQATESYLTTKKLVSTQEIIWFKKTVGITPFEFGKLVDAGLIIENRFDDVLRGWFDAHRKLYR